MNALSIITADDVTPDPTYRTSASSSSPWIVPSSPNGPCSNGNTTSTSPSSRGGWPGSSTVSDRCDDPSGTRTLLVPDTSGTWPGASRSGSGSSATRTHRPSRAIPTGTTSYLSRSIAASTLAAVEHDTACSGDRPPKTMATRVFRPVLGASTVWSLTGQTLSRR